LLWATFLIPTSLFFLVEGFHHLEVAQSRSRAEAMCSGKRSLSNDAEFIRQVREQYRDHPETFAQLAPVEPLRALADSQSRNCYAAPRQGRWCVGSSDKWIVGAKFVHFERKSGDRELTVECQVLSCGEIFPLGDGKRCRTIGLPTE